MSKKEFLEDASVGEKLAKKGFWLYLFTIIILPTGYLTRMMISRGLPVEEVGLLYTILGFITMISGYNDLGLTGALVYYIPNLRIQKAKGKILGLISIASLAQIITTIFISLGLWLGGERMAAHYFNNAEAAALLRRFVLYFVGINFIQVITVVFRSFQDVIKEKVVEAIRLRGVFGFSCRAFFLDAPSILDFGTGRIFGMGLAAIIGSILFYFSYLDSLRAKPVFDSKLIRSFGSYALYSFIGMNVRLLLGQLDQQMVNFFLGNEMAGYYSNFLALTYLATLVLSPLGGYMYSLFSELFAKKDQTGIRKIIELYYHELSLVLLIVSVFLSVFGPEIAQFLFGSDWIFSGVLLRWYTPFICLTFMNSLHLSILGANGQPKINAQVGLIGLIVNLIVNSVGIWLFGVWGVLLGLIISNIVMCLISFSKVRTILSWDIHSHFWIKGAGTLSLIGLSLVGIRYFNLAILPMLITGFLVTVLITGILYRKKMLLLGQEIKSMRK